MLISFPGLALFLLASCKETLTVNSDNKIDDNKNNPVTDKPDIRAPSNGDTEPDERKRWGGFGTVLGKGFSFGKRLFPDSVGNNGVSDSIINDIDMVEAAPLDDKRWVMPNIYGTRYYVQNRSRRDTRSKRFIHYYGNMLGRGFSLGKRSEEPDFESNGLESYMSDNYDENEAEKRTYGGMLGRGFAFGKRRLYGWGPRSAFFGSVLGRGFSIGKRDPSMPDFDDSVELDQEASEMDDIQRGNDMVEHDKRYIYSSPGYRFLFGKKNDNTMEKRYGMLFGRPFSGGKKRLFNFMPKRPYGFVLGNGFSLGKRSGEGDWQDDLDEDSALPDDLMDEETKRSILLGRGYLFGKRGVKRYGWLLGNGLKFGKRSGEMGPSPFEKDDFFFLDDDGSLFKLNEEEIKDINETGEESVSDIGDADIENDPSKRSFGLVLGKGYNFGKRAPSWKRFGHILGGGFSFGK